MQIQSNIAAQTVNDILKYLEWDSNHFGFPIYRLTPTTLSDQQLLDALQQARAKDARLVYWFTPSNSVAPSEEILGRFGGKLVDCRLEYRRTIAPAERFESSPLIRSGEVAISPFPQVPTTEPLLQLGVLAGHFSRFRCDDKIPQERFEAMYRQWMDRSVRREIANVVIVAAMANRLVGTATISCSDRQAQIGLISVAPDVRGKGIGRSLMQAAHKWMVEKQVLQASVVTQGANLPACELYENVGYQLNQSDSVYHFWLAHE